MVIVVLQPGQINFSSLLLALHIDEELTALRQLATLLGHFVGVAGLAVLDVGEASFLGLLDPRHLGLGRDGEDQGCGRDEDGGAHGASGVRSRAAGLVGLTNAIRVPGTVSLTRPNGVLIVSEHQLLLVLAKD